jgi:hypothetical protein
MMARDHCECWDKDLQNVLPRLVTLATSESVLALAEPGGGVTDVESRQTLDRALATGRAASSWN